MYILTLLLISNHNDARVEPNLFGCVFERRRVVVAIFPGWGGGGTKPISANFPVTHCVVNQRIINEMFVQSYIVFQTVFKQIFIFVRGQQPK